jgi:isocitrate dehydrogenase
VLLPNLYGDILSDVAAEIAGSVGLAGSANIGPTSAMFEAIHGSAPRRAGQDVANPSGLMLAAVQMLVHIGQGDVATRMHNAWLRTIEDGVHTYDIFDRATSTAKVGTSAFAEAVIERLGSEPQTLKAARYADSPSIVVKVPTRVPQVKEQIGIDVFLDKPGICPAELGTALEGLAGPEFRLDMLSNRGQKVYPDGVPETLCVDAFRCRFLSVDGPVTLTPVIGLLQRLADAGHAFIKSEGLFTFDGEPGFTKGQGQ